MAQTKAKNGHTHAFAIMDDNGRDLPADVMHAKGLTGMGGTISTRQHHHKWFMNWDRDRGAYKIEFGPGGDDSHEHPAMYLKHKDF